MGFKSDRMRLFVKFWYLYVVKNDKKLNYITIRHNSIVSNIIQLVHVFLFAQVHILFQSYCASMSAYDGIGR